MLNESENSNNNKNIFLHVTGSISCYKACALSSLLVQQGFNVQVSLSKGALNFLRPTIFEGLTMNKVLTPNSMFKNEPDCIPHITLSQKWASLFMIYPASANCITRLASGACDDLFGATILANNFAKPVLLSPAMNENMFLNPAIKEALEKLQNWGVHILPTEEGHLACGTNGKGKLIAPEVAMNFIKQFI